MVIKSLCYQLNTVKMCECVHKVSIVVVVLG